MKAGIVVGGTEALEGGTTTAGVGAGVLVLRDGTATASGRRVSAPTGARGAGETAPGARMDEIGTWIGSVVDMEVVAEVVVHQGGESPRRRDMDGSAPALPRPTGIATVSTAVLRRPAVVGRTRPRAHLPRDQTEATRARRRAPAARRGRRTAEAGATRGVRAMTRGTEAGAGAGMTVGRGAIAGRLLRGRGSGAGRRLVSGVGGDGRLVCRDLSCGILCNVLLIIIRMARFGALS